MYSKRNRFTIWMAAAISGPDPWKCGYSVYQGTYLTLMAEMPRRKKEHGGNVVVKWFFHRKAIADPYTQIRP